VAEIKNSIRFSIWLLNKDANLSNLYIENILNILIDALNNKNEIKLKDRWVNKTV